ncbi:CST complex subunit STN1-like [Henckelia pumila]|uniref:CST complex subunit STN1-like n=1 Tax=Henckelia pumila TaxID=405737 RepID=UPI003C6E368A
MDVKLLALYFLALTPCPTGLSRRGMPVLHVESLGIVVTREHKPGKFLKFTIDDGTAKLASQIHLGAVARVRGKVKAYRGTLQITVSHVVLEADPNAQVLHWLDCVRLGRNCYDKFPNNRDKGKKSC